MIQWCRFERSVRKAVIVASALSALSLGVVATPVVAYGASSDTLTAQTHTTNYGSVGTDSSTSGTVVTIQPVVASLADGGLQTEYQVPGGSTLKVMTPPSGFNPLTASPATLSEYGFPQRPSDTVDLQDWTMAMTAFTSDSAPAGSLQVDTSANATKYSTYYSNWAGYSSGSPNSTSSTYVAVKSDLTIPSITGTCGSTNGIGAWIGLGGTNAYFGGASNNLVQQGVECGNSGLGSGAAFRPFSEFANTAAPVVFCGYSSWTFPAGHVIYQNMSYQASLNQANFYLEDITTGVAHSCSSTAPSGWSFNGNVADWVTEAPSGTSVNFGSIPFSNASTELNSTGTWVTMGSQSTTKWIDGTSSSTYCITPLGIGSDQMSFTDSWHQSTC